MFIVSVMKNLLSVDDVVGWHEVFSAVYCSAMFVRRRVRHLSYRFRRDGRSRRKQRWHNFSMFFNGRRDDERKTVTDYGCVLIFISRTIRYAKHRQTKDESCLLDPRRFKKRWWGVFREKTVIASSSLVKIKGANFYKLPFIFTLYLLFMLMPLVFINIKHKKWCCLKLHINYLIFDIFNTGTDSNSDRGMSIFNLFSVCFCLKNINLLINVSKTVSRIRRFGKR
jgi:hypothetical protein